MVAGLELAREVSRRSVSRQVRLVLPNFGLNVTVLGAALRKRIAAGDTMHAKCGAGRTRLLLFDGSSWSCR